MDTTRHRLDTDPCTPQEPLDIRFDFDVPERSIYKPGTGPAVPEPTIILDHDVDGFIISEMNMGQGYYTYIVGWEDKPHLLVSVRPQKILNYVSARSFEEWHSKKMDDEIKKLNATQLTICNDTFELKQKSKATKKRKRPLVKARKARLRDQSILSCPPLGQGLEPKSIPQPTIQAASFSSDPRGNIFMIDSDSEDSKSKISQPNDETITKNLDLASSGGNMHISVVIQNKDNKTAPQISSQ